MPKPTDGIHIEKNHLPDCELLCASTNPGDLVFDCFMGSGTTQAVAMKLGRRFLGADINLGSIQTTTKRLIGIAQELQPSLTDASDFLIVHDIVNNPFHT